MVRVLLAGCGWQAVLGIGCSEPCCRVVLPQNNYCAIAFIPYRVFHHFYALRVSKNIILNFVFKACVTDLVINTSLSLCLSLSLSPPLCFSQMRSLLLWKIPTYSARHLYYEKLACMSFLHTQIFTSPVGEMIVCLILLCSCSYMHLDLTVALVFYI